MPEEYESAAPVLDGPDAPLEDALLDQLVGHWQVTGTIAGRPADQTCDAEWILNHQFLRLRFLGAEPAAPPGGKARLRYEALVFGGFSRMLEHFVMHWLDVYGGHFSQTLGFGERVDDGRAIRFVFKGDGLLHNTLTWDRASKKWSMVIRQKDSQGKWTTFGDTTFTRTA